MGLSLAPDPDSPFLLSFSLQFVAQPNCQQLLASRWYDEFPGWRRRHWAVKMVTCFIVGLLFPVFSVCYLIAPKSPLGLFIRKPFIKFICHTASYLTFLFLLLLASQHIDRSDLNRQGPPPTIVEWMILPWVLGKCDTIENYNANVLLPWNCVAQKRIFITVGDAGMFKTGSDHCSAKG